MLLLAFSGGKIGDFFVKKQLNYKSYLNAGMTVITSFSYICYNKLSKMILA